MSNDNNHEDAQHTPGPWRVGNGDPYQIVSPKYGGIAWVDNEPAENEPLMKIARANAKLIAAAPDLLKACRSVVFSTVGPNQGVLIAAITKAMV